MAPAFYRLYFGYWGYSASLKGRFEANKKPIGSCSMHLYGIVLPDMYCVRFIVFLSTNTAHVHFFFQVGINRFLMMYMSARNCFYAITFNPLQNCGNYFQLQARH
jgi:hypothetical protein